MAKGVRKGIEAVLQAQRPYYMEVIDNSAEHAGHREDTVETHFGIVFVSDKLKGLSRVQRHRFMNELLKGEFAGTLHACSMSLYSVEEYYNAKGEQH